MRLVMVPVSDGYLRGAALRAAAHKLGVAVMPDSDAGGLAGWLRLPWPTILLSEGTEIPAQSFDPADAKTTLKSSDLRDYFVGSYVRTLALATWWLGGLFGAALMLRRGGILDVPWGFVAGSVAGLAGVATFASAFLIVEVVPQFAWYAATGWGRHGAWGGPVAWGFWVLLAVAFWLMLGVTLGVVCAALPPLRRLVLLPLQRIPAALFRTVGLRRLADFWWTAGG
jgi:hypothetical protein